MVARTHPADEPFFREWNACRGALTREGAPIKRAKARSARFRDLLFPELPHGTTDIGHQEAAAWVRDPAAAHPAAGVAGADRGLAGPVLETITRLTLPVPALLVVGSKGKGTAVAAASHALHRLGHRVGTVTSPPLRWAGERVRIDGRALTDAQYREMSGLVADALERMPAVGEAAPDGAIGPECAGYLPPSGLYTLAGIRYLLDAGVTAFVIEEGLGGLSDEVSLFDYPVVAVTQVFAEHTDVLGGSLEAVAADLLGVVSAATRAVLSYPEQPVVAGQILDGLDVVAEAEVRATTAGLNPESRGAGRTAGRGPVPGWVVRGSAMPCGVGSRVRRVAPEPAGITATNIRLGAEAARALVGAPPAAGDGIGPANQLVRSKWEGRPVDAAPTGEALAATARAELRLPARLSRHSARGLTWFVDAGINPDGVRAALAGVRQSVADRSASAGAPAPEPIVIAGFPDTKDVDACLAELSELPDANVILAGAGTDYLSYETARRHADRYGPVLDVPAALELAERRARTAATQGSAAGPATASPILTVGTMSFAGQVLKALSADVDSWWG